MTADGPRKVFLSHKTVDKELVIDFKETLELLGYETWLDKEDLSARETLIRGILRGMKESCAAVFFVTTSFEDTRFLAAEIEYAVHMRIERGDEFSIITLLFPDEDGEVAPIPEPLEPYFYITPETRLEALRGIIRSLPEPPGSSELQDEADDVAAESETIPQDMNIPDVAKVILQAAVEADGRIMYTHGLSLHTIKTRFKVLVSEQDISIAFLWVDALAGLDRYGYVEQVEPIPNGTLFTVTREGYDAARKILEGQLDWP